MMLDEEKILALEAEVARLEKIVKSQADTLAELLKEHYDRKDCQRAIQVRVDCDCRHYYNNDHFLGGFI